MHCLLVDVLVSQSSEDLAQEPTVSGMVASFLTPYPTFHCLQYKKVGYITSFEHDILGKWLNRPHRVFIFKYNYTFQVPCIA